MITSRALTAQDWHRLNGLLAAALELEASERASWLAALPESGERPESRCWRSCWPSVGATGFDGTSQTLQPVVQLAAAAIAGMRREQAGDRIGPWQLERLLAEGGMGAVWVAQRADGVMQRTAALKLPRAEWVDQGLAERIARERAILARLQHPAIAVLYDAGLGRRRPAVPGARVCRRHADRCVVPRPRSEGDSASLHPGGASGGLCAWPARDPPRSEAGQRAGDRQWTAEAPGLRHLARSSKAIRRQPRPLHSRGWRVGR